MRHVRILFTALALALSGVALVLSQGGLTANAGPDKNDAQVGTAVTLSGSGSAGTTSYSWTFVSRPKGSSATLSAASTPTPSFTPDRNGKYTIRLTVGNGVTTASDTVDVNTVNRPPVADAGPDASMAVGKAVTLNGTGSFDPDNDKLTYQWSVVSGPPASRGLLTAATKSKAKLKIDRAGTFVVQLIVRDGALSSVADQVVVTTVNTKPIANAGPDQIATLATPVQLDGTGSTDVDGDPLTYSWKLKRPGGSSATLSSTSGARPTFVPDVNGVYVATLTVDDGPSSKSDSVTISTANLAPVARAGWDHPAAVAGQKIVLDGSASTDANGDLLTYAWAITKKPGSSSATLGSPNTPRATFTADVKGKYTFTLTVTDPSGAVSTDQILYSAAPPQANAGPDQQALAGATVVLDGSASSHLAGSLWYGWSLLSVPAGSSAAFDDPTDPQPRFVADLPGTYVAQLAVFDGAALGPADTVVVSVAENTAPRVDLGPDQVVPVDTIVTLDSDAVSDPDAGAMSFQWALIARPAASAAAMSSATGPVSQVAVDVAGVFVVQLTATDQAGASAIDTVVITTAKGRPSVNVGPDRGATAGVAVPLAAAVSDPDGTGVAYAWTMLLRPDDSSASLTNPSIANPSFTPDVDGVYVVQVMVTDPDGFEAFDAVVVRSEPAGAVPIVTIEATDDAASEVGPDSGTFTFTRSGSTTAALNGVSYTRSGTATAGADYSPSLPASGTVDFAAGQATTTITITPINEGSPESAETVILTLTDGAAYDLGAPATRTATVTIADFGGSLPLDNGFMHTGTIATAGEVDTWTFSAIAGDRIGVHVGQIADFNDFRPWIRLTSPSGSSLGSASGVAAAVLEAVAPTTGTYTVLVASYDSGYDGTGTYRLTHVDTPGPYSMAPGDQGGALTNGFAHTGEIQVGDVDVWTFAATAGERIGIHTGDVVDTADLRPWLRVWSPAGASLVSTSGVASANGEFVAPVSGLYTVLVSSYDTNYDGTGTYRLEMARTAGPYTIASGDHGGPLTNGFSHTGEMARGDVDVWTFSATAGERIGLHVGDITDFDDLRPWLRLWSPTGASLGSTSGVAAANLETVAPTTGTYTVLVASYDTNYDGTGTYSLELARTAGPYTIASGDQGGPMTNGLAHGGTMSRGEIDVWTFSATAGDRIGVHVADVVDADDLRPWLRLWSPTGASLGSTSGVAAASLEAVAPTTGTYTVLVASYDTNYDGTGTYRLELARTAGPYTIASGDQGGPLTNGFAHTGEMVRGDLDVWTFSATAGARIDLHLGEIIDNDDFRPWLRLWSPTGASLGSTSGVAAAVLEVVAPTTGTYTVLVSSYDTNYDGTGTYRLELTHTAGALSLAPGDQGGALSSGVAQAGTMSLGDVDVWTITAVAGQRITVNATETTDLDDFRPWIRVWAPNGASLGSTSGISSATLTNLLAPVSGTYLVLVASFDTSYNGTGTYTVQATVGP